MSLHWFSANNTDSLTVMFFQMTTPTQHHKIPWCIVVPITIYMVDINAFRRPAFLTLVLFPEN